MWGIFRGAGASLRMKQKGETLLERVRPEW